jgi:putative ATPase
MSNAPLAERLRPHDWVDFIGQDHLLGEGRPLHVALKLRQPHSMILWGPPGVGKTTLARLLAHSFNCAWISLSAVLSGVKEIREAMLQAEQFQKIGQQTLLFIDEIHRFNKNQQDALLPFVESGLITLIGATTENPSFAINTALLSRLHIHVLNTLTDDDLLKLIKRAETVIFKNERTFNQKAIDLLINSAHGDARRLLNLIEQLGTAALAADIKILDEHFLLPLLSKNNHYFDKNGDHFYDQISALHKSVRGSDPDAALYWLCRMLGGDVDRAYLSRRIVRIAWEDIGLADPRALQVANDAASSYERLGSPEGELALAQAVIYLSVAAKSNAGYKAFKEAMAFVKQDKSREVPIHLRNAPTKLMKDLGYGASYRYPHDEPNAYAAGQRYFPDGMTEQRWYRPVERGLEIKIGEKLNSLQKTK